MAAADMRSLSEFSTEESWVYDSGTDSSGSLTFIPIFPHPDLFPYHAIGGSIDPRNSYRYDTSSSSGASGYPSNNSNDPEALSWGAVSHEGLPVIFRQVSVDVEMETHDGGSDIDSIGNCSDLT